MVSVKKYVQSYLRFLVVGRYKYGFSFPAAFLFLAFFPFPYLVERYALFGYDLLKINWIRELAEWWPFLSLWVLIPGFVLALFWAIWFGYKFLNDELEKRDAEDLKRSPEMRIDRAYRLINELIVDGDKYINGAAHPETLEKWDEHVQAVIADWCQMQATQVYMWNSRKYQQAKLEDPKEALRQLKSIHRSLVNFIK